MTAGDRTKRNAMEEAQQFEALSDVNQWERDHLAKAEKEDRRDDPKIRMWQNSPRILAGINPQASGVFFITRTAFNDPMSMGLPMDELDGLIRSLEEMKKTLDAELSASFEIPGPSTSRTPMMVKIAKTIHLEIDSEGRLWAVKNDGQSDLTYSLGELKGIETHSERSEITLPKGYYFVLKDHQCSMVPENDGHDRNPVFL